MIICEKVLTQEDLKQISLSGWTKGESSLGSNHKDNLEIKNGEFADFITKKIISCDKIKKYGFFKHMTIPRFNKYVNSGKYADHVDFFRQEGIRTDWSMTLFLSDPNSYEGGELVIDKEYSYKLNAGDMILYPSGNIHRVNPVTKGERIAAIAWAESYIEDYGNRQILMKLVDSIEKHQDDVGLTYVYNNLLRKWSR